MTNSKNKLSSIFKALDADVSAIEDTSAAVVQEEAEKWPLFRALAPRRPASPAALTPVDKQNWLSAEPTPQAHHQDITHSAPTLSDKLAAGLNKMASPGRSTARAQAPAKKLSAPPKATRAKPQAMQAAKKSTPEQTPKANIDPIAVKPKPEAASFSNTIMAPKTVAEVDSVPTPLPKLTIKLPPAPLTVVSIQPNHPVPDQQVAIGVEEKKAPPPVLATPTVDSLLSLFNLDVPSAEMPSGTPASNQNDLQPDDERDDASQRSPAQTLEKPSTPAADMVQTPVSDVPIESTPACMEPLTEVAAERQNTPPAPVATLQTPGSLKSLLNKFQVPANSLATPAVKTPAFLNRLNNK